MAQREVAEPDPSSEWVGSQIVDLIDCLEEGFALFDADMRFQLSNEKYNEIVFDSETPPPVGTHARTLAFEGFEKGVFVPEPGMTAAGYGDLIVQFGRSLGRNVEFQRSDGRIISASSHRTRSGGYLITIVDVTDRHARDLANARLSDAVATLEEAFALFDGEDRLVMANARYLEVNAPAAAVLKPGTPRSEIVAALVAAGHIRDIGGWVSGYEAERANGTAGTYHRYDVELVDGRTFLATRSPTAEGGCTITWLDITDRRRSEETAALVAAAEAMKAAFACFDADLKLTAANEAFDRLVGVVPSDRPVGGSFSQIAAGMVANGTIVAPDDLSVEDYTARLTTLLTSHAQGIEVRTPDGRLLLCSSNEAPGGGYLITLFDITDHEHTNGVLNDFIQSMDRALILFDADWRLVKANQSYQTLVRPFAGPLLAGERAEAITARLVEGGFYAHPPGPALDRYLQGLYADAESWSGTSILHLSDGRRFHARRHETPSGGYLLSFEDVTDRLASEDRAREMLNDAIQSLDEGIALYDAEFGFVMGNTRLNEFFYTEVPPPVFGEPAGETVSRLLDIGHYVLPGGMPTDRAAQIEVFLDMARRYDRNGRIELSDGRTLVSSSLKTGLGGFLCVFRDITEQLEMEAELERQTEIAHQSEKLSALGELLAGVAHELNNPLSIVVGYALMLEETLTQPSEKAKVERIAQAAERCARIVKTFLSMARQRPMKVETCSLGELLDLALDVGGYGLRTAGVEIVFDLAADLPSVTVDPDQIAQVFTNLIVNAQHVLEPLGAHGRLTLRTWRDAETDELVTEVSDNGPGIRPDIKARIFDPFFTTKEIGDGTGIGLAFCHRIVANHGGRITVAEGPGGGATFQVRLHPATEHTAPHDPVAKRKPDPTSTEKHILVIDDEADVAQLIADILVMSGYRVSTCNSGEEAMKYIEQVRYDGIVSDIKMPGMTGDAFFEAALARQPRLRGRIGFVTGDAMTEWVDTFLRTSGCLYLEKPVAPDAVLRLAHQLSDLDRTRP